MLDNRRILFVEDDKQEIANISGLLTSLKADFVHVATVSEAVRELVVQPYDFVLTDLHRDIKPERNGLRSMLHGKHLDLLQELGKKWLATPPS